MIIATGGRAGGSGENLMEKGYTIASVDIAPEIHQQLLRRGRGLLSFSCSQTRPVFGFSELGLSQRRRTAHSPATRTYCRPMCQPMMRVKVGEGRITASVFAGSVW